jgi:hypothetical protein
MIFTPSDVCLIQIQTKHGKKTSKGILLSRTKDTFLWLLVYFEDPARTKNQVRAMAMHAHSVPDRNLGYTTLCQGNIIETKEGDIIRRIGFVGKDYLTSIYRDVFKSDHSYMLERYLHRTPTGISFRISLFPLPHAREQERT